MVFLPEGKRVEELDPVYGTDLHRTGTKSDAGKVDMTYLEYFPKALREVCKVCMKGAEKYTRGGWRDVPDGINRYRAALLRHFLPANRDEEIDPDIGMYHRAQVAWNALASLELWLEEREKKKYVVERNAKDSPNIDRGVFSNSLRNTPISGDSSIAYEHGCSCFVCRTNREKWANAHKHTDSLSS